MDENDKIDGVDKRIDALQDDTSSELNSAVEQTDQTNEPESEPVDPVTVEPTEPSDEPVVTTPESEPETIAVEQEPSTIAERPPVVAPVVAAAPVTGLSTAKPSRNKLLLLAGGIGLLLVLIFVGWWLLGRSEEPAQTSNNTSEVVETELPKLGVSEIVIEGTVEYMRGDGGWLPVATDTELKEGDSIRTGTDGRAVLTLDDESSIRLDADTSIKLTSLTANQVEVEQLDGIAYSRLIPNSERTYTVTIEDSKFVALGTAFSTIKTATEIGVQVFESSVAVEGVVESVAEGKQFFTTHQTEDLQGVTSDIDIDAMTTNPFITWNATLDEENPIFKDRLGFLTLIKQRGEAMRAEAAAAAEAAARAEAARKAAEEAARQNNDDQGEDDNDQGAMVGGRGTFGVTAMALEYKQKENRFYWTYAGVSNNGFKLVYSNSNDKPTYGYDSSLYISDSDQFRVSPPKDMRGKNYVRVCAFTKYKTCTDYSNIVVVNL